MKLYIYLLCCLMTLILPIATSAGEYIYDLSYETGIDMEDIEKTAASLVTERQNMEGLYSVKEIFLDKAYLMTPLKGLIITGHKNGNSLADMSEDYGRFILPLVTNEDKKGRAIYKCENAHLTYMGMGVSADDAEGPILDVESIIQSCVDKGLSIKDIDIFVDDIYRIQLVDIDTDKGEYIVPCSFGAYSEYGMEDYRLYETEEFWNMMDSIFDEDAIDPEMNGGVPLRGESQNVANNMILYAILGTVAVIGTGVCIFKIKRKS